MKIKNLAIYAAAIAATFASVNEASAAFGVTLRTTASDTSTTLTPRLFTSAGVPTSGGQPVWLVFDVDGDGIFASGALTTPTYDGTQGGLRNALIDPDDFVVFGTAAGFPATPGTINQSFTGLSSNLQTGGTGPNDQGGDVKPTYAILFDNANFADGATFGFNGALTPGGQIPSTGNVQLRIGENILGDQYAAQVGAPVIPEPATTAVFAGLGLGLVALRSLRNRKK